MDRRTFTLQLRDKPPRWLPHKHVCPECRKDHWCTYRDGWLPCQGLLTHQQHSEPCPYPSWTTSTDDPIADMNAMVKMLKRQSGRRMQPSSVVHLNQTELARFIAMSVPGVNATHDNNGVVTFTAKHPGPVRGQHADYIFVDDPMGTA